VKALKILVVLMLVASVGMARDRYLDRLNVARETAIRHIEEQIYYVGPPHASFTLDPTSGDAPLEVDFTNISLGLGESVWDFGDSSFAYTTDATHIYEDPGVYDVTLTVMNDYDTSVYVLEDAVTVNQSCTMPVAAFSGTPLTGRAPMTVTFTNTSTGDPTPTYEWDFGDSGTSTSTSPTHEYTTGGMKTVTLTATNTCGSNVEEKDGYVELFDPWAQMQTIVIGMSAGKMIAKNMTFPTSVSLTMRYWNKDTNTQIGAERTASGTNITVSGATVADGVSVGIQYKTSGAAGGWENVTSWHEAFYATMTSGAGDAGPYETIPVPD